MPGSHRAGGPSVRVWTVVVAVLVVVVGVFAVVRLLGAGTGDTPDRSSTPTSSSTASSTPAASTPGAPTSSGSSPTDSPSASPAVDPATLPELAPAPPDRITIAGLVDTGFDDAVTPTDSRLIPTSASQVARWADRGLPGNPATDTVVIVGADNPDGNSSFARLDEVTPGDQVTLDTYAGTLTYAVRSVTRRPVTDEVDDPAMATAPGRLVLVGARYDTTQNRQAEDVLVVAELTGVTPG